MTDVIFGGDINLFSIDKGAIPRIDESKLSQALDSLS